MKKVLVLVVLLGAAVTLNSCGGEDPEPNPPIVGTWVRVEYIFTGLPSTFSAWENYKIGSWGETGYTLLIKPDGTYKRAVTASDPINDKGTWTNENSTVKFSPDDPSALDDIEDAGVVGLEFDVVGEISSIRMILSMPLTLALPSNAALDAAGGDLDNVPASEFKAVDLTLQFKFDRLDTSN